jgi:hypothetical protein
VHHVSNIEGYLASSKCDVPNDGPVVYLTRDFVIGDALPVVDVWHTKPTRVVDVENASITWRGQPEHDDGCIGTYTDAAVRERFGMVPQHDECIVLDNPKVN